ncbi:MAG: tetratricopeptide repeat protein [Verrucomicrobiota bacterium]
MSDPASGLGKAPADGSGIGWRRWAVLGAICALVIGFYAWSAQSGAGELSRSVAKDTYYNQLVRAFQERHLDLKRDVPPGVVSSRDPQNIMWLEDHGLFDLSYYRGKLYLYFGVTPALVLFWPSVALTGQYLAQKEAVVIFLSAGFLAGAGLLCALWRRYFKDTSFWVVVAGTLALGLANFAPVVLGKCDVWEVALSCGHALTMLALAGVWGALDDARRRWLWLAAASLAYGLALGARPSLLFGAMILLVPVAQAWRERTRLWPLLLAAGGPIVTIGLGILVYNALRFDNPLEFGQRYQLPITPHRQFSLSYFWFDFRIMFLQPAHWTGRFPFVHDIVLPPEPTGYFAEDHPFGVLTNIPLVWAGLAAPLACRSRLAEARSILAWFLAAAFLLFGCCALVLCLHDCIFVRYEMEIASPMVLLGVIGVFGVERALAGQPAWRRAARRGWGLLLVFSVAFNLLASFQTHADSDYILGRVLLRNGRVDEAIAQWRKALEIRPDYVEVRNNLGTALAQKGDFDEAIIQYRKALEILPNYPGGEHNLGKVLLLKGDFDGALACLDKTPAGTADTVARWCQVGNEFLQEPDFECAVLCFQQAIKIGPRSADAYANLGVAFLNEGEPRAALDAWQKALEINPDQVYVQNNLAWLLATTRDASLRSGAKAVALAQQAEHLSGGGNPAILRTLAAAYAETGNYALASATARRGLDLAVEQKNDTLAATLRKEIQLYEAGKTAREGTKAASAPTVRAAPP